ncbi:predicted protein [Naegleria gruberi]|uniref:Predicted protein n=1 Tax=Naegleria gruberi TaxID=5762 RepID=D2VX61_NAEGR|nr:uncharacterized protein NAEGRDRAFT_59471 [Naegleria gruberi]EFC38571.1 predicted protein [Naegleria gruberi]|eukprot:XP_002671315.1 predicted protein [Naegleria gruberi strain NEG-M]
MSEETIHDSPAICTDEDGNKELLTTTPPLNVIFLGHVDAGKSTLSGRILLDTGMIDDRVIEKFKMEAKENNRESWYIAYIMDCSEDEKAKGKTIEVGRAHFETQKKRYTILDAPGHKAYVPNMISATTQADVGILVISARKGEFEAGLEKGGQTMEHTVLSKTLGVDQLIVVVNKIDDPSVAKDKVRYDEIVTKVSATLKGVGWNLKTQVQFIPIDALTGQNISSRNLNVPWYSGPSLIEALDDIKLTAVHDVNAPLRLPIIDRYRDKGCTVVLGKVLSGQIKIGQKVVVMPNKCVCEVIALKSHEINIHGGVVSAGENVELYLKGDDDNIASGHTVCDPEHLLEPVQEFIGSFHILDSSEHVDIISSGFSTNMHIHTAMETITLTKLISKMDKKTGKPLAQVPKFVQNKDTAEGVFRLEKPICIEKFESLNAMGRFVLRSDRTIAVGRVKKVKPLK